MPRGHFLVSGGARSAQNPPNRKPPPEIPRNRAGCSGGYVRLAGGSENHRKPSKIYFGISGNFWDAYRNLRPSPQAARAVLKDGAPAGLARADASRRGAPSALVLKHLLFACALVGYAAVTRQTVIWSDLKNYSAAAELILCYVGCRPAGHAPPDLLLVGR